MSAVRCPSVLKTSTFSHKDKSENTFIKICLLRGIPPAATKVENFFALWNNTRMEYRVKTGEFRKRKRLYMPLTVFCPRLIRSLAPPKILPLGNVQINLTLPSFIRTLAPPKILPLGNVPINLTLPSAYSYFGSAEDTPARQNASKLAFALAYSYLCMTYFV